jgi:hypothetical protein
MQVPKLLPWIGVAALVCAGLSGGCKRSAQSTDGAAKTAGTQQNLSQAERLYGVSPTLNKEVEYQTDVIVMEHGAEAIRAQSSDGFTWTIDAAAQGASQIAVDKILFATGRVVGRVLKVERKGSELDVTLGPMELTDVIKEAHINYSGTLDPANMLVYVAPPDYPGTYLDRDAPDSKEANIPHPGHFEKARIKVYALSRDGELRPLGTEQRHTAPCVAPAADGMPAQRYAVIKTAYFDARPVSDTNESGCGGSGFTRDFRYVNTGANSSTAADIAAVLLGGFSIVPDVRNGLGANIHYPLTNGMRFDAHARLRLDNPRFRFRLDITRGGVNTATVELQGVGGLDVGIEGGTSGDFKNVDRVFAIPVDISFPLATVLPFSATFHQSALVQTLFAAKQAVIRANGEYKIGGTVMGGIVNGKATGKAPLVIEVSQNLANSLSGVSLGVNGLVLGYGGKLIVGLGGLGLVVGPYASINTSVGITRGSDAQTSLVGYTCRSAIFDLSLKYGLGWAIPTWSANIVSAFFSIFHAKPIKADYGIELGTIPIKSQKDSVPPSCEDKPA